MENGMGTERNLVHYDKIPLWGPVCISYDLAESYLL